jgi:DNA-binding beta-propeller fold protein YncE
VRQWGSPGSGNGQFYYPASVAVDASGFVYVADQVNQRIQKFTGTGAYLTQWGSYGYGDGQFRSPSGVAVDAQGNVYVSDYLGRLAQERRRFSSGGNRVERVAGDPRAAALRGFSQARHRAREWRVPSSEVCSTCLSTSN